MPKLGQAFKTNNKVSVSWFGSWLVAQKKKAGTKEQQNYLILPMRFSSAHEPIIVLPSDGRTYKFKIPLFR